MQTRAVRSPVCVRSASEFPCVHTEYLPQNAVNPTLCWMCRDPESCEKNHVECYVIRGDKAKYFLVIPHFKNDVLKGTQALPMQQGLGMSLIYLEQASLYLKPGSKISWFNRCGELYPQAYWSMICSKALKLPDGRGVTAKDYRHLFVTMWRDFINNPKTQLEDLTFHALDAAAAHMMCSSTEAFTNAYGDTNRSRGQLTVMEMYSKFQAFVREDCFGLQSQQVIEPNTVALGSLTDFLLERVAL